MNVTIASMFRDSETRLDDYFERINKLKERIDLRVVVAEGDSSDRTYEKLAAGPVDLLVKHDHGGPKFGSANNPLRWEQISQVMRALVDKIDDPGDAFIWVEGDLWWNTNNMLDLLASVIEKPAVAPIVLAGGSNRFYDRFGFRVNGEMFDAHPPYFPPDYPFVKIDSCGSCFVTRDFDLVRNWDGIWPFQADGQLWLNPDVTIRHP